MGCCGCTGGETTIWKSRNLGSSLLSKLGIVLYVQQALEINFELALGSVTESVTVEADQVSVELASYSISGVVSPTGIVELVWYPEFNEVESSHPDLSGSP